MSVSSSSEPTTQRGVSLRLAAGKIAQHQADITFNGKPLNATQASVLIDWQESGLAVISAELVADGLEIEDAAGEFFVTIDSVRYKLIPAETKNDRHLRSIDRL